MATLAELYCVKTGCAPRWFRPRIFWRTLHWHALPFAPLLLLGDYFTADLGLIDTCGRATRRSQIHEAIRDHPFEPRNQGWLRRRVKFRVSLRRLGQLADDYLPRQTSAPIPPEPAGQRATSAGT